MIKPRILVVDDEQMNIELLDGFLSVDYDILKAYDANEALLIVEKDSPDLILLDIMMPGIDGYEVCKKLKDDPKTMHIPIIMVTALREKEDKIKAIKAGADDFLSKPIDYYELVVRVKSLLRIKQYYDALMEKYKKSSNRNFNEERQNTD